MPAGRFARHRFQRQLRLHCASHRMPGLFGVIDRSCIHASAPNQDLVRLVQRMAQSMRYESSYSGRLVSIPSLGACVGQVEMGPVPSNSGPDLMAGFVAATGERRESAVMHGVSGRALAESLSGMCAGFVADSHSQTSFVFNDLFGRERMFLHSVGDRVYFASEAKALLSVVPRCREFDPRGVAELLACGCTLTTHSLYRHVEVLPPGTIVAISRAGISRHRPMSEEHFERLDAISESEFRPLLIGSLRAEVNRALTAVPSSAISLTGGLDSRMIVASLGAPAQPVPCYTFASMYRTTGDVAIARAVAECCGLGHQAITVGSAFLRDFPRYFEESVLISDGYLGMPGAVELYANRQARRIAAARMTGNWGGEMMRGVRAFKFVVPRGGFVTPDLLRGMNESESAFTPSSGDPLSATLFQQVPNQGYGRYAIERSQVAMRTPFLGRDVVDTLYRAPVAMRRSLQAATAVIGQRAALLQIPTDAGLLGPGRAPWRRAWRKAIIKAEYLTSHGAPDWVARIGAWLPAPLLETRFLGVDKFYHFRRWMRRELAPFVHDIIGAEMDGPLGEWFDMSRVARMAADHRSGRANHTDALDKVMTLAIARRTLLVAPRTETLDAAASAPCEVL